jgi:hypothetical protein
VGLHPFTSEIACDVQCVPLETDDLRKQRQLGAAWNWLSAKLQNMRVAHGPLPSLKGWPAAPPLQAWPRPCTLHKVTTVRPLRVNSVFCAARRFPSSCSEFREVFHAAAVVRHGSVLASPTAPFALQDLGGGPAREGGQEKVNGNEP